MKNLAAIITVYNNSKYLRKCLESVAKQSFLELSVVLAYDEGSSDCSLEICNEFCRKYLNFSIIKIPHCFVGRARNIAAEKTNSTYVTFIDGDDTVPQGSLKRMYDIAIEKKSDCVYSDMNAVFPGGIVHKWRMKLESKDKKHTISIAFMHPVLYDRMLYVEKIRCEEDIRSHEDVLGGFLITKVAQNPVYLENEYLYNYHVHPIGVIRGGDRWTMASDLFKIKDKLDNAYRHYYTKEEYDMIENKLCWSAISIMVNIDKIKDENKRIEQAKLWNKGMTAYFPGWKNYEIVKNAENMFPVFGDLLKLHKVGDTGNRYIKFTSGWRMKIVNVGTNVFTYGGVRGYINYKLHRKT